MPATSTAKTSSSHDNRQHKQVHVRRVRDMSRHVPTVSRHVLTTDACHCQGQSPVTNPGVPGFDPLSEDAFASDDGPETIQAPAQFTRLVAIWSAIDGIQHCRGTTRKRRQRERERDKSRDSERDMSRTVTRDSHGGVTPVADRGG